MAEYRLVTIWRIEAPLEAVYAAIHNSLRWPEWWPGVQKVEQMTADDADGPNVVRRYSWRGALPYRIVFDVRPTRVEHLVAIEGAARGDLEGSGCWHFSRQGTVSVVRYEWHVRSTRWWMNLSAPLTRSMFIRNHARLMAQGGEGLARLLGASLLGQEDIDLMDEMSPPGRPAGRWRERGRIEAWLVLTVGVCAGVLATVAQVALWWLAARPLLETLFRDARLTAALVMGVGVLPPPSTPRWDIFLVATLIHFALSVFYALLAARWAVRLRTGPALAAGMFYGLAIFILNLYGFTLLFPWFAVARDGATLVAHLVFGMVLVLGCGRFQRTRDPERPG